MANNNDNLSGADNTFDNFQDGFINAVTANAVAWGIAPAEITTLTNAQTPWVAAWAIAKNKDNRTRAQITAKIEARKDYVAVLRPFIKSRIQVNVLMTDANRLECGVQPQDKTRTPVPVPNSVPVVSMVKTGTNEMALYFNQPKGEDGSSRRGKPKGATGCLIAVLRGGIPGPMPPPNNPDSFTERHTLTRSPKWFILDPGSAGQTMYIFACWINGKGEQGPWGNLNTFVL